MGESARVPPLLVRVPAVLKRRPDGYPRHSRAGDILLVIEVVTVTRGNTLRPLLLPDITIAADDILLDQSPQRRR